VNGYKITSNVVGYSNKSIFIPAAGYCTSKSSDINSRGLYWTNSLASPEAFAYYLNYYSDYVGISSGQSRCYGLPVRPVHP
jgi:hypothetical protein